MLSTLLESRAQRARRTRVAALGVVAHATLIALAVVRAALPSLRFRPAEAGGRKVREIVEQAFECRLGR